MEIQSILKGTALALLVCVSSVAAGDGIKAKLNDAKTWTEGTWIAKHHFVTSTTLLATLVSADIYNEYTTLRKTDNELTFKQFIKDYAKEMALFQGTREGKLRKTLKGSVRAALVAWLISDGVAITQLCKGKDKANSKVKKSTKAEETPRAKRLKKRTVKP